MATALMLGENPRPVFAMGEAADAPSGFAPSGQKLDPRSFEPLGEDFLKGVWPAGQPADPRREPDEGSP